jgi:putative membrane protein (TIGR04086 family)
MVSTALSAAAAGYDWAACMKKRGLFWGMAAGAVYGVLLFLVTGLAGSGFTLELSGVMTLVVALAGGGIGGILGINRKG